MSLVDTLAPGTRLGPYRIVQLLGRGGMGAVYRAEDDRLGRTVAIKVVDGRRLDEAALARFRREARAAAAISHPNVLRIHEASLEGEVGYLALELAAGGSLADRIKKTGPLPWREAARVGAQVARGLEAVHAAGLVHRDLKPANVLFDESGVAKLSDFGLVRAEEGSLAQSRRLTATGDFVGTPEFASPEQIDGAKDLGPASDLFSLGGTLYQALTGRRPFEGQGPSLLYQVLTGTPVPVRKVAADVPPRLERLVGALLEKDPGARPESAAAVASELEAIAAPASSGPRLGLIGALAGLVAVALAGAFVLSRPTTPGRGLAPNASPKALPSVASPSSPTPSPRPSPSPSFPPGCEGFVKSQGGLFELKAVLGEEGTRGAGISALAVAGDVALAGHGDGTLRLWDLKTGKSKDPIRLPRDSDAAPVVSALALAASRRRAFVVDASRRVSSVDLGTGAVVATVPSESDVNAVAVSPREDMVAFGGAGKWVREYLTDDARLGGINVAENELPNLEVVTALVWPREDRVFAASGQQVDVWNPATGEDDRFYDAVPEGSGPPITALAVVPEAGFPRGDPARAARIVLGTKAENLLFFTFDARTKPHVASAGGCPAHGSAVFSIAFLDDGGTFATTSAEGDVRLWSWETHREIDRIDLASSHDVPRVLARVGDGGLLVGTERGVLLRFVRR